MQWFASYLGYRTHIVELGYLSNNEIVKVMGPIIFTLLTNDPSPRQPIRAMPHVHDDSQIWGNDSCRGAFFEWEIMTVVAAYILELIISSCSRELTRDAQIHDQNTRFAKNFKIPSHGRTLYEKKRWCETSKRRGRGQNVTFSKAETSPEAVAIVVALLHSR
ncbi:hypothetical protein J6590_086227 [Homalodisca vitripennis]|nr:hypothetical protein J6590_086227 [Homalodisca vitripennis]